MNIGKTLYVTERREWRSWLAANCRKEKEVWLVYYRKSSGKPRIPYNDAVEEALCFGWIDSTVKRIDEERFAQRFTPRRPDSALSEMNEERIRRLIANRRMTSAGLAAVAHAFSKKRKVGKMKIAPDILKALKVDAEVWKNFTKFPDSYKRIRIGWIESARERKGIFGTRLGYFLRMTKKNRRYGMVQ